MSGDKRRQARTQGRFSYPPDKTTAIGTRSSSALVQQDKYEYRETSGTNFFQPPFENEVKEPTLITEKRTWKNLSEESKNVSRIFYDPDFIAKDEAPKMFDQLLSEIPWEHKQLQTADGPVPQPRMVAWYGPLVYKYSSVEMKPNAKWPPLVEEIKRRVELHLANGATFNSVLLNLYRDGHDSVAWHSDDELSMGVHPTIASVSLGVTRKFDMAPKYDAKGQRQRFPNPEYRIFLEEGSLLVMDGDMQSYWLHRVPKEYHDKGPRINLTFRTVHQIEQKFASKWYIPYAILFTILFLHRK